VTMKLMTFSFPDPYLPFEPFDFYSLVMEALRAKYRIPDHAPDHGLPHQFDPARIRSLELAQTDAGWGAYIGFSDVPEGLPNTIGTINVAPKDNAFDAFIAGASLLCELVTGSPELPFFAVGNELMVASYGPGQMP